MSWLGLGVDFLRADFLGAGFGAGFLVVSPFVFSLPSKALELSVLLVSSDFSVAFLFFGFCWFVFCQYCH